MLGVYLIHFEHRLHHAGHYIGYSTNIEQRLELHRRGQGAKLMKAVAEAKISWQLARVWEGETRDFERQLHNWKNSARRICPVCRMERLAAQMFPASVATLFAREESKPCH